MIRPSTVLFAGLAAAVVVACSDGSSSGSGTAPDSAVVPMIDAPTVVATDATTDASTPDGSITLACTVDELAPIVTCALQNCLASAGNQTQLIACVTASCGQTLLQLSPTCLQCVLTGFTLDPNALANACASGLPPSP
ncbi:MAG: hypothetical protein H6Q90_5524 [Deltaproteobacteria bacterium]|nr:hypothetical protein [Deltaproteobacteria bacterium]